MIAALFVDERPGGAYVGIPGVDVWGISRDAMKYDGPYPVVAHPVCARWCRLAGLVEARWGHKRGEDGGLFASALASVRRWGGVLEHPAWSDAWGRFNLPVPPTGGGWQRGFCGGWTCHVEQGRYGHPAKKATWLYAFGTDLPALRWGSDPDVKSKALVSWCGNHTAAHETRPRVGKAAATPPEFKAELLGMARSVKWDNRNTDPNARHMPKSQRAKTPPEFRDALVAMAATAGRTAPWTRGPRAWAGRWREWARPMRPIPGSISGAVMGGRGTGA